VAGPCGGAYVAELQRSARLVAQAVGPGRRPWQLVWQSRSGPRHVPWLEPDVVDYLELLHRDDAPAAVLVPIGFVSDHLEVVYDLDHEAARRAGELGLPIARAATVGTAPEFVAMIGALVRELGDPSAPSPDCPAYCCLARGTTTP
jgi:ferrochelatase